MEKKPQTIFNMYIQQLYTNCLAQAAYYIESNGEAAIIDPLRDTDVYVNMAKERGAKIKYIFETHFHADFVSGHVDLAKQTGAKIIFGPETQAKIDITIAKDNEVFTLGNSKFTVLHTPGHTLESSCFLLTDENNINKALFTGDTLFIGDVGRPDLLDGIMTKEELASKMYDSLHHKIMPLEDDIIIYPAHGAGSACGKNIGKETFDTLGNQKKNNYALQPISREDFITAVTDGIAPAPLYFFEDAKINKNGALPLETVLANGLKPLSIEQFEAYKKEGHTIIDTREADVFENGYIPGAINVGLSGQFAIWAANIISLHHPIIIVCENGKENESVTRLTRVGFDNIQGYLEGGFEHWLANEKRYDMVISITPEEFSLDIKHSPNAEIVDVRKESEYNNGHVKGSKLVTLADINNQIKELDPNKEYLVYCGGGYRSMIASSFLKSKGFKFVKNVYGGFAQIKDSGVEIEN